MAREEKRKLSVFGSIFRYIAKTDEKHEDLEYMIQRQRSPSPLGKRTNRQPCYNGFGLVSSNLHLT